MLVVDFMHEVELGVWKALFMHLAALLDERYRQIPPFGQTIRRFTNNVSEMKQLAARDYEDLLQCSIPAFEGILDEPHNSQLMKLLYWTAEWHAFAKLQMHSDSTLAHLELLTKEFGLLMRQFCDVTCSQFQTTELPREVAAQNWLKQHTTTVPAAAPSAPSSRKSKSLNLLTLKFYSLGDYMTGIQMFGCTDSFLTQLV
ncbi:hypothetical protein BC827DRAFT_1320420 [Russula dissimulans]|nr:hypothetical protein BC827DRAFT_1320420 [Russula dissimulans]